ncbi:cobalt/nickel transport system permease protein [Oryzomicrobium terrae]|uniref:Cobalt/nickel transport system permease protein n=1 Tax=Oryzomicrobium terrae TaxID=1735038 RepID=A0A5C1E9Y7_9RHOO|nr:cobalt ECF transporter T component CbiQ [Oryzomicrobium terrae]QEL65088.1 cobalt/nickel transport system permease protein [Oryzomicrobium terrae]
MLVEQSAYANRWRGVCPGAKGLFALGGLTAAFIAATRLEAGLLITTLLVGVTLIGARVPAGLYLRVAAPALFFLAISAFSLALSVDRGAVDGLGVHTTSIGLQQVSQVLSRSLGGLAALLFLVLTTPLTDLIALLRRLRTPEVLLDIMVLCYRSLFVFSGAVQDMRTAQAARLGYANSRLTLRSLGELIANLTLQIWERSQALHQAALARNNDGPLRFLATPHAHGRRDSLVAALAAAGLIALAWAGRGVTP